MFLKKKKYFIPSIVFSKKKLQKLVYYNICRRTISDYTKISINLASHKRQQYFIHWDQLKTNYKVLSAGILLIPQIRTLKYLKRNRSNIPLLILKIKVLLGIKFAYVHTLSCKNFNFRHYLWLIKYFSLIKPHIDYLVFSKSWSMSRKGVRRIKKKIYRAIAKTEISSSKV